MNTFLKIIIGLVVITVAGLVVFSITSQPAKAPVENPIDSLASNLPTEIAVRSILAFASNSNKDTSWQAGSMSEPTLVSEILTTEESFQNAYQYFQTYYQQTDSQMTDLWAELSQEKSVGEWEAVIETYFGQKPIENEGGESTMTSMIPLDSSGLGSGDFGPFGCGAYLTFHPVETPENPAIMNAAYTALFGIPNGSPLLGGFGNIVVTQENLNFDNVTLSNGEAKLFLSGNIMGNHCADPVFKAQIEQTAFQFDGVESLTVYLNNQVFDWCALSDADPSESGCDETPKPWITENQ